MKAFSDYITENIEYLTEATGGKGAHLTHLEDLVFTDGDEGVEHAANILDDLNTTLSGKQKASFNAPKAKTFVAGKFDGAPAIIFGRNPENGKFFVASKSAFNKTPKICYTMEDVDRLHANSPGLADKLREALMYLPTVAPKKGVYQGDMMYDRWSIKKGDKYQEWTPNTLTYRVKAKSEEGRKAFRAKFGIVVHTKYEGKSLGDLTPTPYVDTENFGENPDVHLIPAQVNMHPENWTQKDRADYTNHIENTKIIYKKMKDNALDEVTKHADLLIAYINQSVRGKNKPDTDGYIEFIQRQGEKEANKLKTPERQESVRRKYAELIQHVQANRQHFKQAFELHEHIANAKNVLMKGLQQNTPDYEYFINGKKSGPEGYVVYRDGQDAVKLVNRKEFSKMNFEIAKMKKPTYPVPAVPPVVFAFGRMNPPTGGHEQVVNTVQELAKKFGADQEIVLSGSKDPAKNPLTPEQKVKYASKFFPGTRFRAATKDAPDFLTHAARLYAAGHREFIMVAGPDRAPEFRRLLAAYNGKQGRHGYFKFNHISVVTSKRLPGKSGTEMRGYVQKGNYAAFRAGLPASVSEQDAQRLFNDVKNGMTQQPIHEDTMDTIVELSEPTLKSFRDKRWMQPQKDVRDMKKVWKYGVWPAEDRLRGRFKTKKGYKPYKLKEDWGQFQVVKSRIVPSLKNKKTGEILRGKRGEEHLDIFRRKYPGQSTKGTENNFEPGYYDPVTKKQHGRYVMGYFVDTPDLMTRTQRIRRYGFDESLLLESGKEGTPTRNRRAIREAVSRNWIHKFKTKAKEIAPKTGCTVFRGDTAGSCGATSYAIHQALKKQGKDSHFVVGHYNDYGSHGHRYGRSDNSKIRASETNHAWVVSGGKIIDATHTQFGKIQRYDSGEDKEDRPVGPAVVITQHNDKRYAEYARDDKAIKSLRGWPTEQKPLQYLKKFRIREDLNQLFEDISPSEVQTYYQYHDTLNPALWDVPGDNLLSEVAKKLYKAAQLFIKFLGFPDDMVKDVVITGSNANYNYTDHSDIDLHVLYDKQALSENIPIEYLEEYIQNKRRLFNQRHNITIKGFPVEFYPQPQDEANYSTGVYSLRNSTWKVEPQYKEISFNDTAVRTKVSTLMNDVDKSSIGGCPNVDVARDIVQKLLQMRKSGLSSEGEFSVENLAFKTLRDNGYIKKLIDCIQSEVDKEYSVY